MTFATAHNPVSHSTPNIRSPVDLFRVQSPATPSQNDPGLAGTPVNVRSPVDLFRVQPTTVPGPVEIQGKAKENSNPNAMRHESDKVVSLSFDVFGIILAVLD